MPQPTLASVHVDRPLTNLSIAFLQQPDKFVAQNVFPRVSVAKQSDLYFTFAREDFNRIVMQKRGLSSPSAGSGYALCTDSYFADLWSGSHCSAISCGSMKSTRTDSYAHGRPVR